MLPALGSVSVLRVRVSPEHRPAHRPGAAADGDPRKNSPSLAGSARPSPCSPLLAASLAELPAEKVAATVLSVVRCPSRLLSCFRRAAFAFSLYLSIHSHPTRHSHLSSAT
jgi:hypothetical protein